MISGFAIFVNGYGVKRFDDATVYTTAKNAIAGLVLVLLAVSVSRSPERRSGPARRPRSRAHWLALLAVAAIGGSIPFVLRGPRAASSTQAAFVHKTLVIWVALLAVLLLRERLSRAHYAAIALLIAGQAVLVSGLGTVTVGAGELMIFAATLLWAVEVVVVKRCCARGSDTRGSAARHRHPAARRVRARLGKVE